MYVVVGFRVEKLKSVYYKVCRNIEEVARVFKVLFEQRDAHFASIRRVKPEQLSPGELAKVVCNNRIRYAGKVVIAPDQGEYRVRVEPYTGSDYEVVVPRIEVKTLITIYGHTGEVAEEVVADEVVLEPSV